MLQKIDSCYEILKVLKQRKLLFDIKDKETLERVICQKCQDILIKPFQTPCGCRLCNACLGNRPIGGYTCCPGCQEKWRGQDKCTYDKAVEREICDLEMKCVNESCEQKFKVWILADHVQECDYRLEKCRQCGLSYLSKEISTHIDQECRMSKVSCLDCGQKVTRRCLEEEHHNANGDIDKVCDMWKGVCPLGCSEDVQDNMKVHWQDCPRVQVACIMQEIGCPHQVPREAMDDHLATSISSHMIIISGVVTQLRKENKEMKEKLAESCNERGFEVKGLMKTVEDIRKQVDILERKVKGYESQLNIRRTEEPGPGSCFTITATEGDCLWKVDRISERIKTAKEGDNRVLLSDPFYSSRPRYRLCLKMYPNGDGKGFGSHVSVFFVILKGDYDEEVPWPFRRGITLTLLSSKKWKRNRVLNMRPDNNESCYGRPKSEYNVAAGNPQFVSQEELLCSDDYVDNGAVTIQAVVH